MTDLLMQKFSYTFEESKNLQAFQTLVEMACTPVLSVILQFAGNKGTLMVFLGVIATLMFTLLESLPPGNSKYIKLCMAGQSMQLVILNSVIWSSITLVVPEQGSNIALGIALTLSNIFSSALPVVFGRINELRTVAAYNKSLYLLKWIGYGTLASALGVFIVDCMTGKRLHLPENNKKVIDAKNKDTAKFKRSFYEGSLRLSKLGSESKSMMSSKGIERTISAFEEADI
jgi:hypothetical protein